MKKTIYYLLSVGIAAAVLTFGSCSKKSELPAINGFNSSNDIQTTNLVAHWSFEGNFTESIQGLTPTPSATAPTFETGVKGQAYKGGGDTYVAYPMGTLASIPAFTLSMWYKQIAVPTPNGTGTYIAGHGAQGMLHMYNATGSYYVLEIENEQFVPKISGHDSLKFNTGFQTDVAGAYGPHEGIVPGIFVENSLNVWTHLVMTYDNTASAFAVYVNGVEVGIGTAWSPPTQLTPTTVLQGPAGAAPIGTLALSSPIGLIIGAFPQRLNLTADNLGSNDFGGNFQGGLDEIRIYKVGLTALEVGSLYQLEKAGR